MIIATKELVSANLANTILDDTDLSEANLKKANLANTTLRRTNLFGANLRKANLAQANFFQANLRNSCLMDVEARKARFAEADLTSANLCSADLTLAVLRRANLTNTNLHLADLSGADLTGAILRRTIGLGNKATEIAFANRLLNIFASGEGFLEQKAWHTEHCRTVHCIAGWALPDVKFPGAQASRMYPTLAKFFFSPNEEAMEALRLVAASELSVFPD